MSEREQFRDRPQCGLMENLQDRKQVIANHRLPTHCTSLPVRNILTKLTLVENGKNTGPDFAESFLRTSCSRAHQEAHSQNSGTYL